MTMDWSTAKKIIDYLIHTGDDKFVVDQVNANRLISDSHRRGKRWEAEFRTMAMARGFHYERGKPNGIVDCLVNGKRVQCKAHFNLSSGRSHELTRADVSPLAGSGNLNKYRRSDIDVLALRCSNGVWLFPSYALSDAKHHDFLRSSVIPAKYPEWRDNWNVFAVDQKFVRKGCLPGIEW